MAKLEPEIGAIVNQYHLSRRRFTRFRACQPDLVDHELGLLAHSRADFIVLSEKGSP